MRAALVGSDTLDFNGRLLTNLPDGDVCIVTYPNDLVTTKVGKNGFIKKSVNNKWPLLTLCKGVSFFLTINPEHLMRRDVKIFANRR